MTGAMWRTAAALSLVATLAACSGGVRPAPGAAALPAWRTIATPADHVRLMRWRDAWVQALAQARSGGAGAAIAADAALFAFDSALPGPVPPAGDYRCRVVKLGRKAAAMPAYTAYPFFACRIGTAGGAATLSKTSGSQRPNGRIYADTTNRAAFLGTLELGDEVRPIAYGRDRTRDLAGWVERIGPARWRLALPYPAFESTLDVVELVPAR